MAVRAFQGVESRRVRSTFEKCCGLHNSICILDAEMEQQLKESNATMQHTELDWWRRHCTGVGLSSGSRAIKNEMSGSNFSCEGVDPSTSIPWFLEFSKGIAELLQKHVSLDTDLDKETNVELHLWPITLKKASKWREDWSRFWRKWRKIQQFYDEVDISTKL